MDNINDSFKSFNFPPREFSTPRKPSCKEPLNFENTSPKSSLGPLFDTNCISTPHTPLSPTTSPFDNRRRSSVHRKSNAISFSSPRQFKSSFSMGPARSRDSYSIDDIISNTREQIRRNSTNSNHHISTLDEFLEINNLKSTDISPKGSVHHASSNANANANTKVFASCPESGDLPPPIIDLDIINY
ncbi:hypothetical protein TBLA_0H03395 [Henningerozyma blattae CBS 6284]|uniref:Uncharacterized protein n=1 Tax=Henningerozyma blattae (strain ATCC 34711 / CBS 6284 / DSM 70876 / NBRC 10599 / NRRL Y-10934 / UCD 77-7) TaxID=1071380 RepID=I2H8B9_HENB6|nr:hypothetical protein TBLA_0H03395 [Tetrapisispora blattae CBS 6284]CCH62621.1 hypothetical protein TBLA_0H03395 [Tetrapisispora blattae CBS 6284]